MTSAPRGRACCIALAFLLVTCARPQAAKNPQTYRISGVVVNATNDRPLSQAHVMVSDGTGSATPREMTTGADGKFVFEGVTAGAWTLTAERKSYGRQSYGQHAGIGAASSIMTGPDGVSENLRFRMEVPAAISGKVTDERGEPIAAAGLELAVELPGTGNQVLVRKMALTDDQGEYRLWELPPVPCYLLAIVPHPSPGAPGESTGFAPQYYRDTTDPRTATAIALKPGEEFHADFVMRRAQGVSVTLQGDSGIQGGNSAEMLALLGSGPRGSEVTSAAVVPGQGRTIYNVLPGRYKLVVGDLASTFATSRWIDVGTEDMTVKLPFSNPPDVTAKVKVVDGETSALGDATMRLHLPADAGNNTRPVPADGTVRFPAMAAGLYRITLHAPDLYLKSVTARNAKVTGGMVELPESGAVQLDIVASGDGGRINGKVRAGGKPLSGASVVLAPRKDSPDPDDYRGYISDSDGTFSYTAIRPGEYVLFAVDDWRINYTDPAAIRSYLAAGKVVKVEARQALEVAIEVSRP
jgi:hypothetical protein